MNKIITQVFSILFYIGLGQQTFAHPIHNLYQAELPVVSQSEAIRMAALHQGLTQVLLKLTGKAQIDTLPMSKMCLSKAADYLQEYHYETYASTTTPYLLILHFDKQGINDCLKRSGIAFLSENRPLILAWIAMSDHLTTAVPTSLDQSGVKNIDPHLEILSNESNSDHVLLIKQQAIQYGLPIILPLVDITDLTQMTVQDILSPTDFAYTASKRYKADALLIGRVTQQADYLQSEWQFTLDKTNWRWTFNEGTFENILNRLMQHIHQALMKDLNPEMNVLQQQWLTLTVSNIDERDDLLQLMHYLKHLPVVLHMRLVQVNQDTVTLAILIRGTILTFNRHVALGHHLHFLTVQESHTDTILSYQFVH